MKSTPGFYQLKEERQKSRKWFLPRVLLLAIFSGLAQLYLPWWSLILVCAAIGYFTAALNRSPFTSGFIAQFLVWSAFAFYLDIQNGQLLSQKVEQLFPIPASSLLLVSITGVFGGIIGGFSTLLGHSLNKLLVKVE